MHIPPAFRTLNCACTVFLILASAVPGTLCAQEPEEHEHDATDHSHGAHFTHPLFAESVSPDTKMRIDYARQAMADGDLNEMEIEGEYAFAEYFSIEAGVHYDVDGSDLGETHVLFKFANLALESSGVSLGYGLEVGLPTGASHAHGGVHEDEGEEGADEDIYEFAPFLNAGWISGAWELSGWTLFEIPTNQGEQEEVGTALRYNGSLLVHAGSRVDAIVEAFGHAGLSGPETEQGVLNIAPGIRFRPVLSSPLVIGAGLAIPVTSDEDYGSLALISAFWHF
jgi:hypothetical protein